MKPFCRLLIVTLAMLALVAPSVAEQSNIESTGKTTLSPEAYAVIASELPSANFPRKLELIDQLASYPGDTRVLPLLQTMLRGDLYALSDPPRLLLATRSGDAVAYSDANTGAVVDAPAADALTKITITNALRTRLKGAIANLSLSHPDAGTRLAAVGDMLKNLVPDQAPVLRDALQRETNERVKEALLTALALIDADSADATVRAAAAVTLGESLYPEARSKVVSLLETDASGSFKEPESIVRAAAERSLERIDGRKKIFAIGETVFFGLSLGSVLLLAAIGLAITFGVMGVINMAHGELMMLGAYTTYVVQLLMPNHIDLSLFVAIPAAFLVAGLTGIAIERGVIRFLYGRPLETLLATFGISLVLQQLVRSVFSPLNRQVQTPSWMSGSWDINSALSLTSNRLVIIAFSLAVFAGLLLLMKRSTFGLQLRAVAQNRAMARAMGVRTPWVDALTFGLGSGIAGIAGVALSQLTNVGPNLGQAYIIDSFMVVVFGGVGNLWGMFVGAFSLGVLNKVLEPWSGAVLAKIIILVFIILFIQKRPRGLFPQKGRAAEA